MGKLSISFSGCAAKRPSRLLLWMYYTFGRRVVPKRWRPLTSSYLDTSDNEAKWQLFHRTNRTELDIDHLHNPMFKEERDRLNKEYQFIADALNEGPNAFNFEYHPVDEDWLYIQLGKSGLELGYRDGYWSMDYSYIPRMEQWDHWLMSEGTMKMN
ncbi:hypothetical protein [uncultured Imperialibacter sp.]|uniref:hypothetical protein n=1 Tax=uncultured Imperialibacter sp. TaxID=1672639 RepID=UPI0030D85775